MTSLFEKIEARKKFMDSVKEEFIDAKSLHLLPLMTNSQGYSFALVLCYKTELEDDNDANE